MHRSRARYLLVASLSATVAFAPAADAQTTVETSPVIVAGDTLRVWSNSARLDGVIATFARVNVTDLVLQGQAANPNTAPREWAVALGNVERVDVLRRRARSAGRVVVGVLLGAAVGAAIGAPLGPIIECGGACDKEGDLQPQVGPRLGAMIGAPIGALIGGVVAGSRPARWHTVTFTVR